MEWVLIIKVGMFLGIPASYQEYRMSSFEECQKVKQEYLKDVRLDEEIQIYCIPAKGNR